MSLWEALNEKWQKTFMQTLAHEDQNQKIQNAIDKAYDKAAQASQKAAAISQQAASNSANSISKLAALNAAYNAAAQGSLTATYVAPTVPKYESLDNQIVKVGDVIRFMQSPNQYGTFWPQQQYYQLPVNTLAPSSGYITTTTPNTTPWNTYPNLTYPANTQTTVTMDNNFAPPANDPPIGALLIVTGVLRDNAFPIEVIDMETGEEYHIRRWQVKAEPFLTQVHKAKLANEALKNEEDTELIESEA